MYAYKSDGVYCLPTVQRYMQCKKYYLYQIISSSHVLNIVYLHQLMVTIQFFEQYVQCTKYSTAQLQAVDI